MTSAAHDRILKLLGFDLPGPTFAKVETRGLKDRDGWVLEDLIFTTAAGAKVPALFNRPQLGPVPVVLYCHAHGNRYSFGREELTLGRSSLQGPYGDALKDIGCASLCLDMPCFGERQNPGESELAKALLWRGQSLFGQMLSELTSAVGFLAEHTVVDPKRIGALGFSMGSTHAWWLAALEPRIRAASALCSFADLGTLIDLGAHDGHGVYMTVPGLVSEFGSGEIAGMAAPKPLQIAVGLKDWSTPVEAFELGRADLDEAYERAGSRQAVEYFIDPTLDHRETPEMRAAVLKFFKRQLVAEGT